jgi:hypothetical protein
MGLKQNLVITRIHSLRSEGASRRSVAAWNPIKNLLIPYSGQTDLPMQYRPNTAHLYLHGRTRFAPLLGDAFALGEPAHFNYPLSVKYDSQPGRTISMLSSILYVEQRYDEGKGDKVPRQITRPTQTEKNKRTETQLTGGEIHSDAEKIPIKSIINNTK